MTAAHKGREGDQGKAWRFSTQSVPKSQRAEAWRDAMARLCLPLGEMPGDGGFEGEVSCLISPLGIRFAVVDSEPQHVAGDYPQQPVAIWLSVLLKGAAHLMYKDVRTDMQVGDIIYGVTGGSKASLVFSTKFRQIFINAPEAILNKRFVTPLSQRLGYLPASDGIRQVFSATLMSLAAEINDIDADQLRPLDQSFMEFIIACAVDEKGVALAGNPESARADNLHRICQTIELLLRDPNLTIAQVADAHGVTTRHLQESFSRVGRTFSDYVRRRRLERCRGDLISPLFAQQSVAEICYRWGFGAPAHFSRVFRAMYGVPPSEYRRLETMAYAGAPGEA